VAFYEQYRNLVITRPRKKDIITWQNNRVLAEDEELSPSWRSWYWTVSLASLIHTCLDMCGVSTVTWKILKSLGLQE
jgi:hypothetical protein